MQVPEPPLDPVADWLTSFEDEFFWWQQNRGREFALMWCDPGMCPDFALDWLSGLIAADFADWWDGSWKPIQKRRILVNLKRLRQTRGSADTFRWLLGNFDLMATFEPSGGWLVDISTLPALLSGGPFQWELKISASYIESSREFILIENLMREWLPCWVEVVILRT